MINSETTVAGYLLTRLKEIGVDHLFGVPGDFVLGFFNQVLKSDVQYVGTCNELKRLMLPTAMHASGASVHLPPPMASEN